MELKARQKITPQRFDEFVFQQENVQRQFELIAGEIIEMVSNNYSSEIAAEIIFLIKLHLRETGQKGHVTAPDDGYEIGEERYIPDVAFVSADRQSNSSHQAYNPNTPNLVVEVMFPTDTAKIIRMKVVGYLNAGVVVWVIQPEDKTVEVYVPGQAVQLLEEDDTLIDGDILPQFQISVKDIFPEQYDTLESD